MPIEARVAISVMFLSAAILVLFVESSANNRKFPKFLGTTWLGNALLGLVVRQDGSLRAHTKAFFFFAGLLAAVAPWLPW
jgi:hypothetical protein